MLRFVTLLALAAAMPGFLAGRTFLHPGITYTQGDLDRMKAMVEAGREPWRSTFQALLSSHWSSLEADVFDRGASIGKEQFNQTIGRDGRRAHDLALIYRLTGDERYAKKAVEFLNANSHYTSTSWDGTAALDNGKVFLLIEAAELMRDYPGWAEEDQARFKRMLTAPGCFYEKLKGFDPMRYGNQALFAERGMIAMGIYLDDDRIYERVIRNLKGEKHRPDDEPFPAGPMESGWKRQETECMVEYQPSPHRGNVADWGYDDQIQHYIYPNGQCQESSRDQGHCLCGVNMMASIAEVAWNQGDDLYSFLDNRILLGLEWNFRYNLSAVRAYPDQPAPWEPSGYTEKPQAATFENGLYLQILSRSARWKSLRPAGHDRGDKSGSGGSREAALAHYKVRARLPPDKYKWLERYRDYMIETHGREDWGVAPNWFYEWCGWGTLTKRRTDWMAGDPGTTRGGVRVSGAHRVPGRPVKWEDCDYYPGDGNGRTFRRQKPGSLSKGDWNAFTLTCEKEGDYDVIVVYSSYGDARVAASIDKSKPVSLFLPKSSKTAKAVMKGVHIPAGASVMRLAVAEHAPGLKIVGFQVRR